MVYNVKVHFFLSTKPKIVSPKRENPGVQNIYCSAARMIVCVLHGTPVLGAIYACWEQSSKGI